MPTISDLISFLFKLLIWVNLFEAMCYVSYIFSFSFKHVAYHVIQSKDGTLNGKKMWNKYLVSIKVDKDSVNEENIQKLLKGFCTFLYEQVKPQSADDVKNNRPPVNYAAKSCTEYLAKVKEYYRKDNPNWKIWASYTFRSKRSLQLLVCSDEA